MKRVIGIGETIFDIILDSNNTPQSGKPGGSVYNAMVSLGRKDIECIFISEVGNDKLGEIIKQFLIDNNVNTQYICSFDDGKTPLALAFLDENSNAQYLFYKDYPAQRLQLELPNITADDILLFGSYFALNPTLRPQVKKLIEHAKQNKAIIYYDVNFRATHKHETEKLRPAIIENFRFADIVKGSDEDFYNMFGSDNWRNAYHTHIKQHCPIFICTEGANGATAIIGDTELHIDGKEITPLSTVGAGDSFNAGTIYGLIQNNLTPQAIMEKPELILKALKHGIDFSSQVCQSYDNYISR